MIAPTTLRSTLRERACYSTFVMFQDPAVVGMLAAVGCDFLIIDHEHIPIDASMVGQLVMTAHAYGIACIVRVRDLSRGAIQQALETGADGVMIPMIESAAQARQAVEWSKYPPVGTRGLHTLTQSFLLSQHQGVASYPPPPSAQLDYPTRMNEQVTVVLQIETAKGLAARAEICATEGADVIFIGTSDLSQSLGAPMGSPVVHQAIDDIIASATTAQVGIGIIGPSADALQTFAARGVNFLTVGADGALFMHGARQLFARSAT
jgi:2-keto-3-deoxy-L-rhamnonate aldolase RhmA